MRYPSHQVRFDTATEPRASARTLGCHGRLARPCVRDNALAVPARRDQWHPTHEPRAFPASRDANTRTHECRLIRHGHLAVAIAAAWLTLPAGILKGEEPAGFEQLSAREAVRQGNQLLIEGDAPTALEAYEHAEGLKPEASEIQFVQGLGHYALEQYESAREAFEKAAVSKNRILADDATYSVGTTYHAEALEGVADPQLAIEKLENAMQRYQNVLANQPDHPETRDAIVKAASMRRQLKQMLEQQQEQQQQNQDQDQQDGEEDSDDQQQQQGQDQNGQEEQQQSEAQQQPSDESQEQQDQQQSAQQDEQQEDEEQQQVQESEAEREEQTSREQAQRRLREMMQNIRERQKRRREEPQPFRVAPVDKDW